MNKDDGAAGCEGGTEVVNVSAWKEICISDVNDEMEMK